MLSVRIFKAGLLLFFLGTLWLVFPGRYSQDPVTGGVAMLHVLGGAVLLRPALRWCDRLRRDRRESAWGLAGLMLGVCAASGVWMLARALLGKPADRPAWVFWTHGGTGATAVLAAMVLAYRARRAAGAGQRAPFVGLGLATAAVAFSLAAGLSAPPAPQVYDAESYYRSLTATTPRQARNPLFPSALQAAAFGSESDRECKSCHRQEAQEWRQSAHAHAGGGAPYLRSLEAFAGRRGPDAIRWCEGCHAPERLLGNNERRTTNDQRGMPNVQFPMTNVPATPIGHWTLGIGHSPVVGRPSFVGPDGVGCVSCHGATGVPLLIGNGSIVRGANPSRPWPDTNQPAMRALSRFLVYLRPQAHRNVVSRATGKGGEPRRGVATHRGASRLCSACHRVGLTVAQNGYRFMRGPDEFGTWLDSAVSGHSIHGFRPLGRGRSCESCHMTEGGGHRFAAALEPVVTVDLFAARATASGSSASGAVEAWAAPLEAHPAFIRPGRPVMLDVVVSNRGIGHAFPAGFTDLRDVWLQVTVRDASGRLLLAHGLPDARGRLCADAHGFGLLPLDRAGRLLRLNELDRWVASARRAAGIGPDEAQVVRYRLDAPVAARWPLTIEARLNERRYTPEFQAFMRLRRVEGWKVEGSKLGDPSQEAVLSSGVRVLAQDSVPVGAEATGRKTTMASPPTPDRVPAPRVEPARTPEHPNTQHPTPNTPAERWYHYAIGLLLQDDLPRATRAMLRAQQEARSAVDPWIGLGRVYLGESDLLAARAQFEEAARRAPGDPLPRAFLGTVYRRMGEYDRALALLLPLARKYPSDRATHLDIGLSYLRTGRHTEAATAFTRMLELDPDDVSAHYNLWMCYLRLGRYPEARREEAIYYYLRPDDGTNPALAAYLRDHPEAAVEARTLHEHRLLAVRGLARE